MRGATAPALKEWFNEAEAAKATDGYAYMRKASEKYLQLCYERNLVPKFSQYLTKNADGSYSLNDEYANYWKLLIDRKMVNQKTGKVIIQKAVLPIFDADFIMGNQEKGITGILDEALQDPANQDKIDAENMVVEKFSNWRGDVKNNADAKAIEEAKRVRDLAARVAVQKTVEAGGVKASYRLDHIDGIEFVRAEPTLFMNEDGSMKSESEIFDSLVGKVFRFPDGDVEIVRSLPGKNMRDELFRRFPSQSNLRGVKKPSRLNAAVNRNIEELIENSDAVSLNDPDVGGRHAKQGIVSFDTRSVNFYDGYRAYAVEFSIGVLNDGRKVAYAKRDYTYNKALTEKIRANDAKKQTVEKAVRATGKEAVAPDVQLSQLSSSEPNQLSANENKIAQAEQTVNTPFALDSVGRELSEGQREYFKYSVVRDEQGRLKLMYHGTSRGGFTIFDTYGGNYGLFGTGSYFTDSKSVAESYTKKGKGTNPQVYPVYLNITNPIDMDAVGNREQWAEAFPEAMLPETGTNEEFYRAVEEYFEDEMLPKWDAADTMREALEGMGFDGITHIGGGRVQQNGEQHRVYIAFSEEQIKSVDNKNPTSDPDIHYAIDSDLLRETVTAIDTKALEKGFASLSGLRNVKLSALLDPSRLFDAVAGNNTELRNNLHEIFEKPHSEATGRYASNSQKLQARVEQIALDAGALTVNKKGKKTFHEEVSAAIQNYGEGYHMKDCKVEARMVSEDTIHVVAKDDGNVLLDKDLTLKDLRRNFGYAHGDRIWNEALAETEKSGTGASIEFDSTTSPYTLENLKQDFPDRWQKIAKGAEQFREMYEEYYHAMNSMLEKIYPYAFTDKDDTMEKLDALIEKKGNRIKETQDAIETRQKTLGEIEAKMASKKRQDTNAYDILRTRQGKLNEKIADLKELQARYQEDIVALNAKKNFIDSMNKSGDSIARMHKLQYRSDYFHHFMELTAEQPSLRSILFGNSQSDFVSPAVTGRTQESHAKGRWAGFFMQRKGGTRKPDAVNGMLKYGQLAEYKLAFDPFVAYLRNTENAIRKMDDMKNRNTLIRYLNTWANAIAGKRTQSDRMVDEHISGGAKGKILQVVDWLQSRAINNTLPLNNRSAIVQISNIANATSIVTDGRDWINGIRCWAKMAFQPTHPVRGATADFSIFRGRICEPDTSEFVWRTKE